MSPFSKIHEKFVLGHRVIQLAKQCCKFLPSSGTVLEVGCGSGELAKQIMLVNPDLKIRGIDILMREETFIPVETYDGEKFPADDKSYDAVLFADVLHHTTDPLALLAEAVRVSSGSIVIKDHLLSGYLSKLQLRFMDWVGNARYGVQLPYNYLTKEQWLEMFEELRLRQDAWSSNLDLYNAALSPIFDRSLHFLVKT